MNPIPEKALPQLFKSHLKELYYILKSGEKIAFLNHLFWTSSKKVADELDAEIEAGFTYIYRDANELTIDPSKIDPLEDVRRQAVEDYKAKIAAINAGNMNLGNSVPGPLMPASSSGVKMISAGSISVASPAAASPDQGVSSTPATPAPKSK